MGASEGAAVEYISIHALLAESDSLSRTRAESEIDFYPRSPCGERRCFCCRVQKGKRISIHALLAESDAMKKPTNTRALEFLSTLSLRRATSPDPAHGFRDAYFYPRSPCGERQLAKRGEELKGIFLSTLSLRRATWTRGSRMTYVEFLSTLSLRRATEATF